MTYEQATALAQGWGFALTAILFAAAVLYAIWPGNREDFKRASGAPLDDGNDNGD